MDFLKDLCDEKLLSQTRELVSRERKLTTEILWHLREVKRRMLYAKQGYASLHAYVVGELKYCDGSAQRRIKAMELIQDFPESEQVTVKEKLEAGVLQLSTMSLAQSFIQAERRELGKSYSLEQKRDLISQIEGKSRRTCERELAAISPLALPNERMRAISATETELKLVADQELSELLRRVRGFAPVECAASNAKLLKWMAEKILKQVDPREKIARQRHATQITPPAAQVHAALVTPPAAQVHAALVTPPAAQVHAALVTPPAARTRAALQLPRSRYIPASVRRRVWQQNEGRCAYVSKDGRQCRSELRLEVDHIEPFGKGGPNTAENLRLLCPAHNRLKAMEAYGIEKMSRYVATLRR